MSDTVTTDPLQTAATAHQDARTAVNAAKRRVERAQTALGEARKVDEAKRDRLAEEIAQAARSGRGNAEIRRITGYTRERVRQICRAAGVESAE